MSRRADRSKGSASVELVLMTPVLVALLLFVVALGRLASAKGEVDAAARDAARAAANERSVPAARSAAVDAAGATLLDRGVECRSFTVRVDLAQFRADGLARATVTCAVSLESLGGAGLSMSRTLSSTFTAPVDAYRGLDS
jgi:Flp pilus assembly protein TadG